VQQILKPLAPFIFASGVTIFGVWKLQDMAVASAYRPRADA
jgi:hypothetical protein